MIVDDMTMKKFKTLMDELREEKLKPLLINPDNSCELKKKI